jgi:hypothetical protein
MKLLLTKLKIRYYKFKINLIGHIYNFEMILENLVDKLSGRKYTPELTSAREYRLQQRENTKLRRGIEKLTKRIYDPVTGKLNPIVTTQNYDLMTIVPDADETVYEKMEKAQITAKVLSNPTDSTGTDKAIVEHVVRNAPVYVLEKQKRDLHKQLTQAIKVNDLPQSKRLTKEINNLNNEIKLLKKGIGQ